MDLLMAGIIQHGQDSQMMIKNQRINMGRSFRSELPMMINFI